MTDKIRLVGVGDDGSVFLPSSVEVAAPSSGDGQLVTPTVRLDTYYDSVIYANKTAAINAAVAAVQALGGTLECRHGRVYSLDTGALSIAPGAALKIVGNKATLQANWGKPRCVDFTRTVDYCTFQDVQIDDLTFDAHNLTSSNHESIVGDLFTGTWGQRINATRITLNNCRWINVPVGGGAIVYECFALGSRHLGSGETRTNLTEIRLNNARMSGGDVGAAVIGTGVSGATNAGVEVYHDQIYLDVTHDTGVVPTSGSSGGANVQVGSVGWGDYCEVKVHGANSGDVGVEIDGMMTAIVRGTVIDAKNADFYCRNFHPPRSVTAQKNTFTGCVAITRNVDKGTIAGTSKDYAVGGDSTTNFAFGEMVMDNCTSQIETVLADWTNSTAMCLSVDQMYIRRIKIVGTYRIGCTALNTAPATGHTYIFNNIWSADPRAIVEIDGIALELAGTLGITNTSLTIEALRTSATSTNTTKVDIGPVTVDASGLSNANATNYTLKVINMGVNTSSFFTGRIRGPKATNGTVGGWTAMNLVAFNTNFHVGGTNSKLQVEQGDSALWTSSAGSDYVANSAQFAMISIRTIAGRRATGAPFSTPTAITVSASPFTYQNGDLLPQDVIVSGGTVSVIAWSLDNVTFFTTGLTAGRFHLESGEFLKVTYSVLPTMTKVALA